MAKYLITISDLSKVPIGDSIELEVMEHETIDLRSAAYLGMRVRRIIDDHRLDEVYRKVSRELEPHGVPSKSTPLKLADKTPSA